MVLWIHEYHQNGLNDQLGGDIIQEDTHVLVESKFPALPRTSTRIS